LSLRANDTERALFQSTLAAHRDGYVSQLELLDDERSEPRSRRQALQARAAQVQATVGLIRVLGGGWIKRAEIAI
jgi:multidrug efflux system outer membrane protein